ncbi:heterokaryon incompatibility protein domain-containing protein [Trichoderma sp. SZMC 28013]
MDISNRDAARSLVCDNCWNGLFAHANFRSPWENPGWENNSSSLNPELKFYNYTSTWSEIDASSQAGCNWCSLLLSSAKAENDKNPLTYLTLKVRVSFQPPIWAGKDIIGAQHVNIRVEGLLGYQDFRWPIYTLLDDPCADEVLARERIRQMKSTETCRVALHHLSQCLSSHKDCHKPAKARLLPARVIDCADLEKPKLYITGGNAEGSYVALSYVWGEDQPNKTRQCNLDKYAQVIEPHLLPQTARDAIWVTRTFGERYLWIDAFCIIQDSTEDKRREIARIPTVFADASFTIIAARSFKVSQGFLHDCPPPSLPVHRLPFPLRDHDSCFGTMYVERDEGSDYDNSGYDDSIEIDDPVHKRTWCLEERLLSPRAFAYTSSTLRFYCQMSRINVGNAVRQVDGRSTRRLNIDWKPQLNEEHYDPAAEPELDHNRRMRLWDNILHDYSGRTVTQPEDKLIALAGVASRFGVRWKKGEYLAGLWLNSLPHDILWRVDSTARLPRPRGFRAPSWSWASLDSTVEATRSHPRETLLYELKDHEVKLASDLLPFGGVTSACLRMRARLLQGIWRDDSLYVCPPQVDSSSHLATSSGGKQPEVEPKVYRAWLDTTEVCNCSVWLLLICWRSKPEELAGLIVVAGEAPGEYIRVGCFQDYPRWMSIDGFQDLGLHDITFL